MLLLKNWGADSKDKQYIYICFEPWQFFQRKLETGAWRLHVSLRTTKMQKPPFAQSKHDQILRSPAPRGGWGTEGQPWIYFLSEIVVWSKLIIIIPGKDWYLAYLPGKPGMSNNDKIDTWRSCHTWQGQYWYLACAWKIFCIWSSAPFFTAVDFSRAWFSSLAWTYFLTSGDQ